MKIIALAFLLTGFAFAQTATYEEAKTAVDNNRGEWIDVRADWEYTEGHVPCAPNIDLSQQQSFQQKIGQLDKNKTYYVYCFMGGRSAQAVRYMKSQGFTKVYNVSEGISGMKKKGVVLKAGSSPC